MNCNCCEGTLHCEVCERQGTEECCRGDTVVCCCENCGQCIDLYEEIDRVNDEQELLQRQEEILRATEG